MLEIENLNFSYNKKLILQDVSLKIARGEIVSLIGVSGSGKTTLFRLITGLIEPHRGLIKINNEKLPKGNEYVTYMRQEDLLLPWRTVLGNLELFNEIGKKKPIDNSKQKALELLEKVGLKNCDHLFPKELSGGMRQRVSLARALLQNRPLFLLDEPFGSLDVIIREQLYNLLKQICQEYSKTILLVTHDFRDALALSDRILILSQGQIVMEYVVNDTIRVLPDQLDNLSQSIRNQLSSNHDYKADTTLAF